MALVGYWKLDEGTGTTAKDSSFRGKNGTFVGSPSWSTTVAPTNFPNPYSLLFNPSNNEYVSLPVSLGSLAIGSFSCWFKAAGTVTNYRTLISLGNFDHQVSYISLDFYVTNNRLRGTMANSAGNGPTTSSYVLADTNWHHAAFTWDASFICLYVDGSLVGSPVAQTITPAPSSDYYCIGGYYYNPQYTFNGNIDEVRIYNHVLTSTEVADLAAGNHGNLSTPTFIYGGTNIVGHYRLDEGTGSNTVDTSGKSSAGTLVGSPTWSSSVPTRIGFYNPYCVTLSGSGQYVTCYNAYSGAPLSFIPRTNAFSISAWIKSASTSDSYIVSKAYNGGVQYGLLIQSSTGRAYLNAGQTNSVGTTNVIDGNWHHIVMTVPAASTGALLYVDGAVETFTSGTGGVGATTALTFDTLIGARRDTSNSNIAAPFRGSIDDVRFYAGVLTPAQIVNLYNGNDINNTQIYGGTGLIGHWRMDEGTGTSTTSDSSGQSFTGTLVGSPTWSNTPPSALKFYNPYCLTFDGSTQYIMLPDNVYQTQTSGSVSMWVNFSTKVPNAAAYTLMGAGSLTGVNNLLTLQLYGQTGTDTRIRFGERTNSDYCHGDTSISNNAWHHLVWTATGATNGWVCYVDGHLETLTFDSGTNKGKWFGFEGASSYGIAGSFRYGTGWTAGFPGSVDDVRVYNRVLSQADVTNLYNGNDIRNTQLN